jgi:erythromycin esterase
MEEEQAMATARHLALVVLSLATAVSSCVRARVGAPPEHAQQLKVEQVRDHLLPARSIDPDDQDFSDLMPLKSSLNGVRVVLLGEASHGDGATFLGKTRLIKFLHQHLGFDLLVFESGFYDCSRAWPPRGDGATATAFEECAWATWSQRRELAPLVEYLDQARRTSKPLILAGLDPDVGVASVYRRRAEELRRAVQTLASGPVEPARVSAFLEFVDHAGDYRTRALPQPNVEALEGLVSTAADLAITMNTDDHLPRKDRRFWALILENIVAETRARLISQMYSASPRDPQAAWEANQARDRQMARNLAWLMEEGYPGRKAILWTATEHAGRHLREAGLVPLQDQPTPFGTLQEIYRRRLTLGDHLWDRFGSSVYAIGFTALDGISAGGTSGIPISAPSPGSLEDLLGRTGREYAFLDLRHWPEARGRDLVARPFGYAEMRTREWSTVLDGLFFIRTMTPSTRRDDH